MPFPTTPSPGDEYTDAYGTVWVYAGEINGWYRKIVLPGNETDYAPTTSSVGEPTVATVAATVTVGTLAALNTTSTNLAGVLGDDNPANYVQVAGTYAIASGSTGVSMPVNGEITFGSTCKATINASIQLSKDPLAGASSDRYSLGFFLNGSPIGNPSTVNVEELTKAVQVALAYSGSFTSGDVLTIRIAQKAGSSADNPMVERMAISLFGF